MAATHDLRPSFKTAATRPPQDEVLVFSHGLVVRSRAAASRTMRHKGETAFGRTLRMRLSYRDAASCLIVIASEAKQSRGLRCLTPGLLRRFALRNDAALVPGYSLGLPKKNGRSKNRPFLPPPVVHPAAAPAGFASLTASLP